MKENVITRWGLLDAQVCSSGTWDEALDFIRREMPAGTENNWQKNEAANFAPVPCADGNGRMHYMFQC